MSGALFFDADQDNDMDLYIVSGGNEFKQGSPLLQDRLFLNDGKGNFTKTTDRLPEMLTSGSCVVAGDYDGDGDMDLFVGGRLKPGAYPFPGRSYILRNDGAYFKDVTVDIAPGLVSPGMVTDAVWSDFDADGQIDLILTGEWMPISFYRNNNGHFENVTAAVKMDQTTGWWNTIVEADLDQDGDMDYVAGNLGLNYKYRATEDNPFHIYCHDFDGSGTLDIVLGYFNIDNYYPVRGRECTSQQMPGIKKVFPTYHDFGMASLSDVYGKKLDDALHYEAKNFASVWLENDGRGQFEIRPLPNRAQISTVQGIIVKDFNHDDHLDILIAGNFYVSEIETGRADAGIGLLLRGDGSGKFTPVPFSQSGFLADKDARRLAILNDLIIVGNNDDQVQVFKINTGEEL